MYQMFIYAINNARNYNKLHIFKCLPFILEQWYNTQKIENKNIQKFAFISDASSIFLLKYILTNQPSNLSYP